MTKLEDVHNKIMSETTKGVSPFEQEDLPQIDEEKEETVVQETAEKQNFSQTNIDRSQTSDTSNDEEDDFIKRLQQKRKQNVEKEQSQNVVQPLYDDETEEKLTSMFGVLLPNARKHEATLTKVVPFEPTKDTPVSFDFLVGKRVTLVFSMINPNNNKVETGYHLNLSYATVTKETQQETATNWEFEVVEGAKEKVDFLAQLIFGKYGVKSFEDLIKLNQIIEQGHEIKFDVFSHNISNVYNGITTTKIVYTLTNHGRSFLQAETVPDSMAEFCLEQGGTLPAKIFKIQNNESFRRFELYLLVKDAQGKEHTYCKKYSYARKTDEKGRNIGYKQANTLPPDYALKAERIETIMDKLVIDQSDWNKISKIHPLPVNISITKTTLRNKKTGETINAIEII